MADTYEKYYVAVHEGTNTFGHLFGFKGMDCSKLMLEDIIDNTNQIEEYYAEEVEQLTTNEVKACQSMIEYGLTDELFKYTISLAKLHGDRTKTQK